MTSPASVKEEAGGGAGGGGLLIYLFTYLLHVGPHPRVSNSLAKPLSVITVNQVLEVTIVHHGPADGIAGAAFSSLSDWSRRVPWTGCIFGKAVFVWFQNGKRSGSAKSDRMRLTPSPPPPPPRRTDFNSPILWLSGGAPPQLGDNLVAAFRKGGTDRLANMFSHGICIMSVVHRQRAVLLQFPLVIYLAALLKCSCCWHWLRNQAAKASSRISMHMSL